VTNKKILFITGTDTGVGKTLLTASLLHHLRGRSVNALAIKPFCSGGWGDVHLIQSLQPGEISDSEANPFYFSKPIAPLVAGARRKKIQLHDVVKSIQNVKKKCDRLLIEGSGGLLVPLGPGYTVADLIARLDCRVLVTAHNRLGTINHTLLTINALKDIGIKPCDVTVVLMGQSKPDLSSKTNQQTLTALLKSIPVLSIPYLGIKAATTDSIKKSAPKIEPILAKITK
jgi:dethiobiotin synthetase